jgi:hypothetical protein
MSASVPILRLVVLALVLFVFAGVGAADAGERYALIVTGASGGPQYAKKYQAWRESLIATLRDRLGYPQDHLVLLADEEASGIRRSTRENVRAALADLRRRVARDDVVLVLLVGHGTALDGDEGKFNLVGPDLTAGEWAALIRPIPGRVVFVNTTSGSFPFLNRVAGQGRIVLTATDSALQQYDTVFPEFFVKAFDDDEADLDKNRKVSIWEAFVYASAGVKGWYDERGRLATERPLLDDTGRGVGREAEAEGPDGALARATFLQPDVRIPDNVSAETATLMKRRAELEAAVEQLRANKATIPPERYDAELETLLLELTRVDSRLRSRN